MSEPPRPDPIRPDPIRILLVGATGLIGTTLIQRAVGRERYRLTAIARREAPLPQGARMELLVADPADWGPVIGTANADAIVIALGTTWRASGRNEAVFRATDKDLVLACAQAAKAAGVKRCIVVSSVGAAISSRGLYFRVKGEVEDALAKLKFDRLDILRPGLLRGPRAERRPAEKLAMLATPLVDPLLHGSARKYRSVRATTMADAILALAAEKPRGRFIHEHDEIVRAADRLDAPSRR
ncbi:NAD(P)H-binding protein [Novosphingobium sp. Gsoil 351]|uniref:NAD(P)H-binding protein n=1 Tax=Novosphingobium sp. Gsoil 351 TaxID=2675225 RepID=UPI0012B4916B|nr:NAD(P)H-binding protein [Novosphingobium sp. Gsoil 351]QGN53518.1 NAD(P)H-binding protein [Novosphingobium sp. Gsoil 351]